MYRREGRSKREGSDVGAGNEPVAVGKAWRTFQIVCLTLKVDTFKGEKKGTGVKRGRAIYAKGCRTGKARMPRK